MTTLIVYGIPNCSSVKKTRDYLSAHGYDYVFHDFKKQGIDINTLNTWVQTLGFDKVLNKKGTTYRNLDEQHKHLLNHLDTALPILVEYPSLIKRPVVLYQQTYLIGFDLQVLEQTFPNN